MSTLSLSIQNEFYKLRSRKKYIVLLIVGVVFCALRLGGNLLVSRVSHGSVSLKSNMLLEMLPICFDILIPLVVFMAVTDLFAGEIQEDTMKASLLNPVSRFKVLTSKASAVFLLSTVYALAFFVICLVFQLISGEKIALFHTAAAYIIDLVPVIGLIFLAVLLNMLSKSPSLSMLLCIGVYALFKSLNYFEASVGQLVFTAYSQWHKLWLGSGLPFGAMASKVGILLGSILTLYMVSYIIFDKKDF